MYPGTICLAEDLQVGDVLVDTALGGTWNEKVTAVRVHPDAVDVFLGVTRVNLNRHEVCSVVRAEPRRTA